MTIEVNIEEVPAQHAVMLRFRCPYSNISEAMTEAFSGLIDHISAVGVEEGDITGPFFALYHNTENIENWDISVGFPVAKPIPEGGKVTMGALPGGKVAVSRHVGDYSGLKEQWELVMNNEAPPLPEPVEEAAVEGNNNDAGPIAADIDAEIGETEAI